MEQKVSVIIPTYNRAEQLQNAVNSVINQSYKNLEIIIIDDCSTDNTQEVIKEFINKDKRIVSIRTKINSRQSKPEFEPRNNGLKIATGEFVCYLDSDNVWLPSFVEEMVEVFNKNPDLILVHCDSLNFYPNNKFEIVLKKDKRNLKFLGNNCACYSYNNFNEEELGEGIYIDTNEMMHRNNIYDEIGGYWRIIHPNWEKIQEAQFFQATYRRHNDLELFERIFRTYGEKRIYHLDRILVKYIYEGETTSNEYSDEVIYQIQKKNIFKDKLNFINPHILNNLDNININKFYTKYLEKDDNKKKKYCMGVGEIDNIKSLKNHYDIWKEFIEKEDISDKIIKYGGTGGMENALNLIAKFESNINGITNINHYNIVPMEGCHEIISTCIKVFTSELGNLYNRKQYIISALPAYPYVPIAINNQRGSITFEAYTAKEFVEGLKNNINENVGAIIVNIPNNPMGYMLNEEQVEVVNKLARKYDCAIIVDCVYQTFVKKEYRKVLSKFAEERTVYANSFSKSFGVPGLRLGYCYSKNMDLCALLRSVKSMHSLLPSAIKLKYIEYILENYGDHYRTIAKTIKKRKNEFLKYYYDYNIDLPIIGELKNDFYITIDVSSLDIKSDREVVQYLKNKFNLEVVAGDSMFTEPANIEISLKKQHVLNEQFLINNKTNKKFIRLSFGYSNNYEEVIKILKRLSWGLRNEKYQCI